MCGEDLSSNPRNPHKIWIHSVNIRDPSVPMERWKAEKERLETATLMCAVAKQETLSETRWKVRSSTPDCPLTSTRLK